MSLTVPTKIVSARAVRSPRSMGLSQHRLPVDDPARPRAPPRNSSRHHRPSPLSLDTLRARPREKGNGRAIGRAERNREVSRPGPARPVVVSKYSAVAPGKSAPGAGATRGTRVASPLPGGVRGLPVPIEERLEPGDQIR